MNFDWTAEDKEIKTLLIGIFDQSCLLELEALEDADLLELKNITSRFLKRLARIGYLGIGAGPVAGSDTLGLMAGQEELARISGSLFLAVEVTARIFAGLLRCFGGSGHVGNILEAVERGDLIGAVAVTEPAEQEYDGGLGAVAWLDGSDYVVNGKKDFVTNGPIADCLAILVHVEGQIAICVVEPGLPGLVIGPRMKTLGYNGVAVSAIELNEVRVPRSQVLGPISDRSPLEFLRLTEDLVLIMASVGLIQRTIAEARKYSGLHQRSGKPIFAHQEIRFKLAEMLTLSQTSQLLAFRAGWMCSVSDSEAATLVRCAKVFAAEASEKVASMAMQIMAGQGYLSGNIMERGYRDAKYAAVAGTTSERARMAIADDLLKRYV